jgi:cytoskeletal protein CcmA (bactofilin family)
MVKGDKEVGMSDSNAEYPTVIGADASFKGELTFEKGVHLLGRFEGEVATKGNLLVAEGARLSGDVKAGNVRIEGEMSGNLESSGKVHLTASAKLEGDLQTARLEVADGATFVGRVAVGAASAKSEAKGGATRPAGHAERTSDKPKTGQQGQPVLAGKS